MEQENYCRKNLFVFSEFLIEFGISQNVIPSIIRTDRV
jgi:hypothetical protein